MAMRLFAPCLFSCSPFLLWVLWLEHWPWSQLGAMVGFVASAACASISRCIATISPAYPCNLSCPLQPGLTLPCAGLTAIVTLPSTGT